MHESDPKIRRLAVGAAGGPPADGAADGHGLRRRQRFPLLDCLGWKDAGIVYAGGNMAVGDIQAHPEQLEAARQLGAAL